MNPEDQVVQGFSVGSLQEAVLLCSLLTGAKESYAYNGQDNTIVTTRASVLRVLDEFNRFGVEAGILDKPQVI